MGKLQGMPFTGSLGDVTAYYRAGSDHIILRTRKGVSGKRVKNDPKFIRTRENGVEFGGRATASRWVMRGLYVMKPLADYNIAGPINALFLKIQMADQEGLRGQRNIILSKNPALLSGFSLNRKAHFDTIVRSPFTYTLSREALSASVEIPALVPDINFVAPKGHAMYQVIAMLAIIPDIVYTGTHKPHYKPLNETAVGDDYTMTEWRSIRKDSPVTMLELKIKGTPPTDQSFSLMLTVGIQFGVMQDTDTVQQVKHAGAAKVLAMG